MYTNTDIIHKKTAHGGSSSALTRAGGVIQHLIKRAVLVSDPAPLQLQRYNIFLKNNKLFITI